MKNKKQCLLDLLLNIENKEFKEIEKQAKNVNVFNILKLSKAENKHSNMLSWLFSPNENHGIGSTFSRYFLSGVLNENKSMLEKLDFDYSKLLLENIDSFIVYREKYNIDILLVANNQLICIENKIDTMQHDNQLDKYETILANNEYKNFQKLFLYLTPNEEDISQNQKWYKVSYKTIINSLQKILDNQVLSKETDLLIRNYKSILEREIMNETKEIEKLCTEIYKKYKTALDLIFEYRPDNISILNEKIMDFLSKREDVIFDTSNCSKMFVRFTTQNIERIFPKQTPTNESLGWKNGHSFMYEISLYGIGNDGKITISAVLSHYKGEEKITKELEEKALKINQLSQNHLKEFGLRKRTKNNPNWNYIKVYSTELANEKFYDGDLEMLTEKVLLNLKNFIENDLLKFEKIILNNL